MVTGAAGNDLDVANVLQEVGGLSTQGLLQHPRLGNPTFHRGLDHFRLLVDFLEHEVTVLALIRRVGAVLKAGYLPLDGAAIAIEYGNGVLSDIGDIAFFQEHEPVGHWQQRQLVRRDEVFANTHTNDQGAALTAYHEVLRFVGVYHRQGIGSTQTGDRRTHGIMEITQCAVVFLNQVRDDFGIGLRRKLETVSPQFLAQLLIVFDDPVVDNSQPVAGHVRMGVDLRGLAVGCPAGMGNAQVARERVCFHGIAECGNFTHFPSALDTVVATDDGHTGRIISPVFQTAQTLKKDTLNVPFRNRAYNSTHAVLPVC